jgi:hypothetical protein
MPIIRCEVRATCNEAVRLTTCTQQSRAGPLGSATETGPLMCRNSEQTAQSRHTFGDELRNLQPSEAHALQRRLHTVLAKRSKTLSLIDQMLLVFDSPEGQVNAWLSNVRLFGNFMLKVLLRCSGHNQ